MKRDEPFTWNPLLTIDYYCSIWDWLYLARILRARVGLCDPTQPYELSSAFIVIHCFMGLAYPGPLFWTTRSTIHSWGSIIHHLPPPLEPISPLMVTLLSLLNHYLSNHLGAFALPHFLYIGTGRSTFFFPPLVTPSLSLFYSLLLFHFFRYLWVFFMASSNNPASS